MDMEIYRKFNDYRYGLLLLLLFVLIFPLSAADNVQHFEIAKTGTIFNVPKGFYIDSSDKTNVVVLSNYNTYEAIVVSANDIYEKMHASFNTITREEVDKMITKQFLATTFHVSIRDISQRTTMGLNWFSIKMFSNVNSDFDGLLYVYTQNGVQYYFMYTSSDPWNYSKAENLIREILETENPKSKDLKWEKVNQNTIRHISSNKLFVVPKDFKIEEFDNDVSFRKDNTGESISISVLDFFHKDTHSSRNVIDKNFYNPNIDIKAKFSNKLGIPEQDISIKKIANVQWCIIKQTNKLNCMFCVGVENAYGYIILYLNPADPWNYSKAENVFTDILRLF